MQDQTYVPEHRYSVDEFMTHFDYFATSPEGTKKEALIRYFAAHYPNRSEALYKLNRFGTAFAYMMRHLGDFEQFVIVGEERRAVVSRPLVIALARYFCQMPKEYLHIDPEVETISELAKEEWER
jgi:hypothetical protein